MIDIKAIRAEPDKFIEAAKIKHMPQYVLELLEIDKQLMELNRELQEIKTAQNIDGKEIANLSGDDKKRLIDKMAERKSRAKLRMNLVDKLQPRYDGLMLLIAQPPSANVPAGKDDTENVVVRQEGSIRQFDFEPKDHVKLGESLGMIDIPRGVKISGSRNYFLKGAGAMLHHAVLRLAIDQMIAKGYTLMSVPVLVDEKVMCGTGYFPLGRDQAYLCERDEMSLVGTAEVPITAYHSGEILDIKDLPKKYIALSTCFRREAGSAGKDTYGLYRIHQFDKVEQVIIGPNNETDSINYHTEILNNSEDVLKALELPYRVVNVCGGDLGQGQVQKFDIETWMPSRNNYCETHSASRFHEFQARRLNIRYRDVDDVVKFVHTLNNTVIASPRILIPIMETYQNSDGTITIPKALRPYMNGLEAICVETK